MNTEVPVPSSPVSNDAGRTRDPARVPRIPERATITAGNIMSRRVISVGPHTHVRDIARLMREHRFAAVPVVDAHEVVGIVTDGDLLRREELGTEPSFCATDVHNPACEKSVGQCAHQVMSAPVISVAEDTMLVEIAELMEEKHIRHVPVLTGGKLVGMISRTDLVRTLVERPDDAHIPLVCDDDIVRFKVIETLLGMRGASGWLADVTVTNGVVHLSGFLEDEAVRDPSRRVIEELPCVVSVNDRRAILQPY